MTDKKKSGDTNTLLIELLTEELPPKALKQLGQEFALKTLDGLAAAGLVDSVSDFVTYATPRRLAVSVPNVRVQAPDTERDVQGPSTKAPAQAVEGFARKCGIPADRLQKQQTPKGEIYVARVTATGQSLAEALPGKIDAALKALPVPKIMRWGTGEARFARPVHGLVMMHGSRVIAGEALGAVSSNRTAGHRFLAGDAITLEQAGDYERTLLDKGKVLVDFVARRTEIVKQLLQNAGKATLVANDALLDEITAIVEAPAVYAGEFSPEFLEVPEECLILSMQQHQKYVPLRDGQTGKLLSRFLFVSNIETTQPDEIIRGNERVLRARLSDAKFFYDQDRKTKLADRVQKLANVVYVNKLGSQLERVERVKKLAGTIATELKTDANAAGRAAWLSKADLLTDMVGEFPELQGTMGRYYALNDGESKEVAEAIEAHYRPRFAGDALPNGNIAIAVALAEKLDSLVGLFGVGQAPTGDRDPFGLRRAALGVIRILSEHQLGLDLDELLKTASNNYPSGHLKDDKIPNYLEVSYYVRERAKSYLRDLGYTTLEVESVLDLNPIPAQYVARLEAVRKFLALPEAASLAESDKRIRNIISKSQADSVFVSANESILQVDAEKSLLRTTRLLREQVDTLLEHGKFSDALLLTAQIHGPVNQFFEKVMVNVEDASLRNNRFALLHEVGNLTNRVAHIFKLAA
jgi:glycyl-tRNA synthetase beta chain